MLNRILQSLRSAAPDLLTSKLFDEKTFYSAFLKDLRTCREEVIIESPFITARRMATLMPEFQKLMKRGVRIALNTRDPQEHDDYLRLEAESVIAALQDMGVQVLYTVGHHRKLAILDRKILWEGSLNILSQNDSCEVMRRTESMKLARDMIRFTGLDSFIKK